MKPRNKVPKALIYCKTDSDEKDSKIFKDNIIEEIREKHCIINTNLPLRTDVRAEIRTPVEMPVWGKWYTYLLSANKLVNKEMAKLLEDGIVRPLKSPFHSPMWVFAKKGQNGDGFKKQRLLMDLKKIKEVTITGRYPILDTNIIISNLGHAKYFSKIDLDAGFYQLLMKYRLI